jgi:very-short-patch-repair endonuclease
VHVAQSYERKDNLNAQGINVMRFWNHEVLIDIKSILNRPAERIDHDNPT